MFVEELPPSFNGRPEGLGCGIPGQVAVVTGGSSIGGLRSDLCAVLQPGQNVQPNELAALMLEEIGRAHV